MRIQDKGRPLHPDAHFKIRPRIFLEGNFFVDVTPGTSSTRGRRRPHLPGQPDRHAGAARPGADRAADRHARGPQDAAARVRRRPQGQGRQGLQRARSSTGSRPTATRRSCPRRARREGARPLRLHRPRRRRGRRARPQPRAAQGPDHELPRRPPARSRARTRTSRPRSPSCRARCAPPSPRSARSTARSPACAASPATSARASRTPRRRSTSRCRCSSSCAASSPQPELRGLTADLRPTVPALASFTKASVPLSQQVRAVGELPDRGHPAVEQGQARGRRSSRRPGRSTRSCRSRSRASPARAAPVTPTASGSACSPPAARTSSRSAPGVFGTTALPILGVNPPKPKKRPPLRRRRAVREPADARPALDPRRAARAAQGRHRDAGCSRTAGRRCASTASI